MPRTDARTDCHQAAAFPEPPSAYRGIHLPRLRSARVIGPPWRRPRQWRITRLRCATPSGGCGASCAAQRAIARLPPIARLTRTPTRAAPASCSTAAPRSSALPLTRAPAQAFMAAVQQAGTAPSVEADDNGSVFSEAPSMASYATSVSNATAAYAAQPGAAYAPAGVYAAEPAVRSTATFKPPVEAPQVKPAPPLEQLTIPAAVVRGRRTLLSPARCVRLALVQGL